MGLIATIKSIGTSGVFYAPPTTLSCKVLAFLVATTASMQVMGFISFDVSIFFRIFCVISIFYCLQDKTSFNKSFVFLYLVFILNVTVLDIAPCFKSGGRLIQFIIVTLTCSACLCSSKAVLFRRYLFRYLLFYISLLVVGSFFSFFLGVNYMQSNSFVGVDAYASHGGLFGGLTRHSMTLGPMAMIAAIIFYVEYQERKLKLLIILFFISSMCAVMAASRAALLGIAVAVFSSFFFLKETSRGQKRRAMAVLFISAIVAIPIADTVFEGVLNKQEQREEAGGGLSSRQSLIDCRLDEFKKSPLLGVGFASVDPDGNDVYNKVTGQIEPGSSHLAVLSMTGLLGMLAYLSIIITAFKTSKCQSDSHSSFVLLLFIAIFTHAFFEGYALSAGGYICFAYWLIIGQNLDSKYL